MSEPWTNTIATEEVVTPASEDVPALIQNEVLNLDNNNNNNNNDSGGITIQDTNGLSIVPISSSPPTNNNEEEETDDLILENKSNGPCSNDNAEYSNNTQPCPNAIVPPSYSEIFDDLVGFVNGTEVHPEIVDDDNGGGGGGGGVNGEEGGDKGIGFDSSSIDELIDDEEVGGDENNGGSTNDGGDTNNNTSDNTTEEKAPWTDNTNPGGDTNIILINNIPYSTYYSCTATEDELVSNTSSNNNNNNGVEELPIEFSYEIYTPTETAEEQRNVLDNFERQLAKGVADSLGLVNCNTDIDFESDGVAVEVALRSSEGGGGRQLSNALGSCGGLRRSLLIDGIEKQQIRLLDSTSSVVGVSMNPIDMVDTEIGECMKHMCFICLGKLFHLTNITSYSSSFNSPAKCTSTTPEQLAAQSVCSPILGAMTAWLTVSQRRHLRHLAETSSTSEEEMLLSTIETYINTNQDIYLNDDLLHVSYIGDRSTTTEQVDAGLDTSKIEINPPNDDGSMNPGMIGLAVAMAVLAVIAALVGVAYHRRRQQRQRQFSPGPVDLEEGAFPSYGLTPESESLGNSTEAAVNEESVQQKDLFGIAGVAKSDDDMEEEEDVDDEEQAAPKPSAASSLAALGAATVIARELSYSPMVVAPKAEEEEEEDVVVEEVDTSSDDTEEENGIQESTSSASAVTPVASPHQNPEHSFSDIVPTMSPMTDGVEEEEETSQQSSEDSSFFVDTAANTNANVTSDQSHIDTIHDLMFGCENKENATPSASFDDDRGIV